MSKDRSRPVFGLALGMLGSGVLLLVASLALSSTPQWQHLAKTLLVPVPYLFLVGFALLVVYVVLRPKPEPTSPSNFGPNLFGKDTTAFASRLDSGEEEDRTNA